MNKSYLLALSIVLASCGTLPISEPLPVSQTHTGVITWQLSGEVTDCGANSIEDMLFKLDPSGAWNASYTLKNYDMRESRKWESTVYLIFANGAEENTSIEIGNYTIPSARLKKVKDQGNWKGQDILKNDFASMTVTVKHDCFEQSSKE